MYRLMLYSCIEFESNQTIGYGDIAFPNLGDTESVVTHAVVLVVGEYQISMTTYLTGGGGGGYIPSYKTLI